MMIHFLDLNNREKERKRERDFINTVIKVRVRFRKSTYLSKLEMYVDVELILVTGRFRTKRRQMIQV